MRALLLAVGVLGLAAIFGLSEPASASARPVTSDGVRLVSEQMAEQTSSQVVARTRNGNGGRRGGAAQAACFAFIESD